MTDPVRPLSKEELSDLVVAALEEVAVLPHARAKTIRKTIEALDASHDLADAALAAKDARIAELEAMLAEAREAVSGMEDIAAQALEAWHDYAGAHSREDQLADIYALCARADYLSAAPRAYGKLTDD
jgi:hypothetical protein